MNKKKDFSYYVQVGLKSIALLTAAISLAIAIYYWRQPILEFHGFRQTQTALTAYWMMQEGWQLDYQTPVAGYPWAIPFEFPIYQSVVALIADFGGFPLDPTGRFVSLFFLFACAIPAFGITRRLDLPPEVPWVFSTLLWSSPVYLFWGRTFMIETAAVFFTFAAVPYAIDLIEKQPQWRSAWWFIFWMTLGMLQKITTALPVMIVLSALMAIVHFGTFGLRLPNWHKTTRVFSAFTVPVLVGGLWSYYTDIIRSKNVLGQEMISRLLITWNFGTLQQRFDPEVFTFLDRIITRNLAGVVGILVLGTALIFSQQHIKKILLVGMILFLLPIEMFINLNYIHDYYQTSSVLYIIGGFSVAIVDLAQKFTHNRGFIILSATFALVLINLYTYKHTYWTLVDGFDATENRILLVSSVIKKYTPPDSVVVVFGADWDSGIAYYSERKSFTIPGWQDRERPGKAAWQKTYQRVWRNPEPYLGDQELGALVFCDGGDIHFAVEETLENQFVRFHPKLFKVSGCYLWLPTVDEILLPGDNEVILPIDI